MTTTTATPPPATLKQWLGVLALVLDFVGALVVAWGSFFMTEEQAVWLAAPRWGGTHEQMLQLPQVQNLLLEARVNRFGMLLIAGGFLLQIYVGWPGLPRWARRRKGN